MAIPSDATSFGEAFSDISVDHTTRMTLINAILDATRELYTTIDHEMDAENLSLNNQPTAVTTGSGDAWDDFRGNNVSGNAPGLNNDVQDAGEALFAALNALS